MKSASRYVRRIGGIVAVMLVSGMGLCAAGQASQPSVVVSAATEPSSLPARRPGPVTVESLLPDNKMTFNYSDTPVSDVAMDIAKTFNFRLVDPFKLQQRVTMKFKQPVGAAEAIELLDQTLMTLGYTVIREAKQNPPMLELRITTATQQQGLPVFTGGDPAAIPNTDELRTQIITLTATEPDKARDLVLPVLDTNADVTINAQAKRIIITDTSKRIKTAASLIQILEKQNQEAKPAAR